MTDLDLLASEVHKRLCAMDDTTMQADPLATLLNVTREVNDEWRAERAGWLQRAREIWHRRRQS